MTNEQAIKILKARHGDLIRGLLLNISVADINIDLKTAYSMAIQALEKQTPKLSGCYLCDDTSNSRYFKNKRYNYCPYCSQKLDWS